MQIKHISIVLLFVIVETLFLSCGSKNNKDFGADISSDPKKISKGKELFELQCNSCHNFKQNAIGPSLNGLTRSVETSWIKSFIKSSRKMIDAKNPRATALKERYKAYMPDFQILTNDEIDALITYLHIYEETSIVKIDSMVSIQNAIKETIPFSMLKAQLQLIAQVPTSNNASPFTRINKLACENSSGRLFVNDLRGFLFEIKNKKIELYLSLKELMPNFIDKTGLGTGFGSFAFHPAFSENGLFYTTHTETPGSRPADFTIPDSIKVKMQWVVTEWKPNDPNASQFSGTKRELMRFDFLANSHGVQEVAFNPNSKKADADYGMLYIGLGDGGAVQLGYPKIADHHGTDIWCSVLRIDPLGNNSANKNYGIPKDNPFANSLTQKKEIWAYGFRNPNRISWDNSGRMLVSEIGQANIEELNVIESGKFYGWPIREGTFMFNPNGDFNKIYPLPENDSIYSVTYPIVQYDHDEGPAISGGFTSKGVLFKGMYIFGDIPTGRLFISDLNSLETSSPIIEEMKIMFDNKETTLYEMTGSNRVDLKFGMGRYGKIYLFTKADGKIYKLKEN